MIDLRHPLAVPTSHMPWQEIEASLAHHFVRKSRAGNVEDLFGTHSATVGGGTANAGRQCRPPTTPTPLEQAK